MYQVEYARTNCSLGGGGAEWYPKIKVAQNGLKHILVLKFLKCDEILKIGFFLTVYGQTHHSDQLSRAVSRADHNVERRNCTIFMRLEWGLLFRKSQICQQFADFESTGLLYQNLILIKFQINHVLIITYNTFTSSEVYCTWCAILIHFHTKGMTCSHHSSSRSEELVNLQALSTICAKYKKRKSKDLSWIKTKCISIILKLDHSTST